EPHATPAATIVRPIKRTVLIIGVIPALQGAAFTLSKFVDPFLADMHVGGDLEFFTLNKIFRRLILGKSHPL
ncbi:MAG TPA: hypothetical protein VIH03_03710, partial [Nitrososphaerales archaeon]